MMELKLLEPVIEDGAYCWLVSLGSTLIGVHAESGWCARIKGGALVLLDAESKFVPIGPLLELRPGDFFAFLQRAASMHPSYGEQVSKFPVEALLKHIFHTSYSSYWPERALTWLAAEEALWPRFQEELQTFSKNKVMPQQARQHAQKMLRATSSS